MPIIEYDFGKPYEVNDLVHFKNILRSTILLKVNEIIVFMWKTVTGLRLRLLFYDRIMALEV